MAHHKISLYITKSLAFPLLQARQHGGAEHAALSAGEQGTSGREHGERGDGRAQSVKNCSALL